MALSIRQSTELFHLVFLRALVAKGEDKVEFSRRDDIEGTKFEAADREVLRPYGLTPVLVSHYTTAFVIRQKIHALAARTEPQARDVFDHAMGISFDEYVSKVVAYLEPTHAEIYADRSVWDAMQEDVVVRLEVLR